MAEMDSIAALAKDKKCWLIEDCAQSLGASLKGKKAGTFGDFAVFSFHGQKNITTLGEGGMLSVRSKELAAYVPGLRHNGVRGFPEGRPDYWVPAMANVDSDLPGVWPYNFSLGEIQCALGEKLLGRVEALNEKRRRRTLQFKKAMAPYPELQFQGWPKDQIPSGHLLPAQYRGEAYGHTRNDLIRLLSKDYGNKAIVQYYPLYRYPLYQKMGFGQAQCPTTDEHFDHMVSFPFHEWMSDEEFAYMIASTQKVLQKLRDGK